MSEPRKVERVVSAQPTSDGAGVKLFRTIGTPMLDHVDPFLLLDEFRSDDRSDYLAGFPDHPHRGFETVTYMLAGVMEHKDHLGNTGRLDRGSVQWMTAGRGIIHSEMPKQEDGLMWGFQLWVNLPAEKKMCAPRYQDIPADQVPELEIEGGKLRIIAGESQGVHGAVTGIASQPLYLDVRLSSGGSFEQSIPPSHNAVCYPYEGTPRVEGTELEEKALAVLGPGDRARVEAPGGPVRFLLLAAKRLEEPIARYGPFVMTTREEIQQAFHDYRTGAF